MDSVGPCDDLTMGKLQMRQELHCTLPPSQPLPPSPIHPSNRSVALRQTKLSPLRSRPLCDLWSSTATLQRDILISSRCVTPGISSYCAFTTRRSEIKGISSVAVPTWISAVKSDTVQHVHYSDVLLQPERTKNQVSIRGRGMMLLQSVLTQIWAHPRS